MLDNKTNYEKRFDINLTITSGYTVDYGKWIDRLDASAEFDIPWDLLKLTVAIDDVVLYQGTVDCDGVHLHHEMLDTDQPQQHRLTVAVDGFSPAHSFLHQGQEINAQLLISQFQIENLDLISVISADGVKIFDGHSDSNPVSHEMLRSNHAQILDFTTPIYPWLLSKFSYIKHRLIT
jgi:hypothetical protein